MPSRPSTSDSSYQREAADGGYFAALAPAKYMLLTTFKREGTPVSTPVQGVIDGKRAYFRVWRQSGTVKRLRHTAGVQVTPCTVLGLCSFGPPINATKKAGVLGRGGSYVGAPYDRPQDNRSASRDI